MSEAYESAQASTANSTSNYDTGSIIILHHIGTELIDTNRTTFNALPKIPCKTINHAKFYNGENFPLRQVLNNTCLHCFKRDVFKVIGRDEKASK